ncbi:Zn-dependent exopeptidases superfamily protein [Wolffia australiana]
MGGLWPDSAAFKCLGGLGMLIGILAYIAYPAIYVRQVQPLGLDAPHGRFSEARAIEHIRYLSVDIDGRQEGKPGLIEAGRYIKKQLETMQERAGPGYRIDIDEMSVSGSFNMMFMRHGISFGYRNHTNILFRISSKDSNFSDSSVLVNGHFDSPLGSPGAVDCGSCIASMLELVRLILDSGWIPPQPLVFLFNGAEEIFLLGSHGFMKSHEWASTLGAFINVEATGTGGVDLVCQSGPGSWPSFIYAESAVHPMGQSSAQDLFDIMPSDTDYRIIAKDYGNVPGLDIIFLMGGYYYHTSHDTLERLIPGSIQARGENLYSLIKAFTTSPFLQNAEKRSQQEAVENSWSDRPVYFDYLSQFMIIYSGRVALFLHNLPISLFFLVPCIYHFQHLTTSSLYLTFLHLTKGMMLHAFGIILGIFVPIVFAILRLCVSRYAMSWYAHPYLAYMMFIPSSLVGLLIPSSVWGSYSVSDKVSSLKKTNELLLDRAFWGAFGFYGFINMGYTLAGIGGGYMTFFSAAFMLPAWISFCLSRKWFGIQSFRSWTSYVMPLMPNTLYSVYFGIFLVQFVIEKMGFSGSLHPYGYFLPDIIVAATVGLVTGLCLGPLLPVVCIWLARSSVINFLLQVMVVAMAVSSQLFPYSIHAPKRVGFHHTFLTSDSGKLLGSTYDFTVLDSNSVGFLFKYSPEATKLLEEVSGTSVQFALHSDPSSWLAVFPMSILFSRGLKFPVKGDAVLERYKHLPRLVPQATSESSSAVRKIHLEIELGSLSQIWSVVLNITGPLSNWSFADNVLPEVVRINGGPPSYICRLTGQSQENWAFWLEAPTSEKLRVDLALLDQYILDEPKTLLRLFPDWADVIASTSFLSTYYL